MLENKREREREREECLGGGELVLLCDITVVSPYERVGDNER